MIRGSKFKTRESFEAQLKNAMRYILKKKEIDIHRRRDIFENSANMDNYNSLKESIVYLAYIIVFVTMILYQTNNTSSQKAGWPVKRVITT
jgi:hypothetical protein